MEYAKKLLVTTDMKISEIAQKVGYTSENSFYAVFKKTVGCTPNQYRENSGGK